MADDEKNEQNKGREEQPEGEKAPRGRGRKSSPPRRLRRRRASPGCAPRRGRPTAEEDAPAEESTPAEDAPGGRGGGPHGRGRRRAGPADAGAADDDQEGIDWKVRAAGKSRQSGEARPQHSPEDRAAPRGQAVSRPPRPAALPPQAPRKGPGRHRYGRGRPRLRGPRCDRAPSSPASRQDDHGSNRRRPAPPRLREDRPQLQHPARPRRGQRGRRGRSRPVIETRPLSKIKRWRLVEILEKAK